MAQLGQFALALAWVVTAYSIVASLLGIRLKHDKLIADRKSTRLNSSHLVISYAVFCLKKKKKENEHHYYRIRKRFAPNKITQPVYSRVPFYVRRGLASRRNHSVHVLDDRRPDSDAKPL